MTFEEQEEWLQWVLVTSIPLKRLDENDMPIVIASGCLMDHRGRRFILSAAHNIPVGSADWVIEVGDAGRNGTEFYRPTCFMHVNEVNAQSLESSPVDFAYAEVHAALTSTYQHLTPRGPLSEKRQRQVFNTTDICEPDPNEIYAFAGEVSPEMHGDNALVTDPTVYPNLRYVKSVGSTHVFQLPVAHPGHELFRGCSGAPIVDSRGNVVALVSGGDTSENVIYGLNLHRQRFVFDFYCDKILPKKLT